MQREWLRALMVGVLGLFAMTVLGQEAAKPAAPDAAKPAVTAADKPAATAPADKAQSAAAKRAVDEKDINPLVLKYQQGGMTMWWLSALSLAGLAFAIERAMQLRRANAVPDGFGEKINGLWKAGKFAEVQDACKQTPSTLARVVAFVAEHRNNELSALNEGIGDIVRREFRKHNRRAYPLAVVGTLSPLLGLFGTVVGLLEAFEAVAVAGSMDDPSILANSIAKALITTVYGLIIAMPALGAYHFFKTRTGDLLDTLDEEVSRLMNGWYLK